MRTAVVLFTRDLRLHDTPALAAAARAAEHVVPLFVRDPAVRSSPHRDRFLAECLADLRKSLRAKGSDLIVRDGDPAEEALKVASTVDADGIALAGDVSAYAKRRERRLSEGAGRRSVKVFPSVTIVPPGLLRPTGGGDHYRVFTPYFRAWEKVRRRDAEQVPAVLTLPPVELHSGQLPALGDGVKGFAVGGETAGRARFRKWLTGVAQYGDRHDDMPGDATSRMSPYLHFGCVSPLELATRANEGDAFVRQLCWRDFYAQVLHGFGDLRVKAYRANAVEEWRYENDALEAWQHGHTGVPIVDAGMRQLLAEGWMHNRARLITASFLTKQLNLDWRAGAAWFDSLLLDADVANNYGNWQWVAGTGNDTKPYRRFNPFRQAYRFDPHGDYVRRYVPELRGVAGKAVHEPWDLTDYPRPVG
jgi:deoxyribodipyrimidine photo-lyase